MHLCVYGQQRAGEFSAGRLSAALPVSHLVRFIVGV